MDDRLVDIEMKVMFLEKQNSDLDESVRALSSELSVLRRRVSRLEAQAGGESSGEEHGMA